MSFAIYIAALGISTAFILARSSQTSNMVKIILVILLSHGYLTTWATFKQVSGYPTQGELPEEFEVLWARVIETQSEKTIELWVSYDAPILDKIVSRFSLAHGWNDISRVYRIPYTEENHRTVLDMQAKIEMGQKVGVILDPENVDTEIDLREAEQQYQVHMEGERITK